MHWYGLLKPLAHNIFAFLFIEIRLSCALGLLFFMRREWIPARMVIAISVILSFYILPLSPPFLHHDALSFMQIIPLLLQQAVLGFITALLFNFFIEFFIGFGQIISMQAGLGFVSFFVPQVGSISPLTHFFMLTAIAIFFSMNAHLLVINMLIGSITSMPALPVHFNVDMLHKIVQFSGILYEGSVMLSLAVMFSIMLSNMTLAVLSKFSPQLNLFSFGINISLLVCFFMLYLSFDIIQHNGTILFNELIRFMRAQGL